MPQISNSVMPNEPRVDSKFVFSKLSAKALITIGALGANLRIDE
jgi:hypothetical protein